MMPETVARVAQIKNYAGLKDAAGNLDQTSATRAACPERFLIWSGDDSLTLPMLSVGAIGVISVASHLVGKEIAEMVNAYHAGDVARAKEMHLKLLPLFKVLFITANPTPVKAALAMVGKPVGVPRLPLIEANEKEKDQIRSVLKGLKLI